jgi:hypothetical protein
MNLNDQELAIDAGRNYTWNLTERFIICYIYSSHDSESTDPVTEIWQLFLKVIVMFLLLNLGYSISMLL